MHTRFASLALAAAALAAMVTPPSAQASPVTVNVGDPIFGATFYGSGKLSFSADLLAALDTGAVSVDAYGAATATVSRDSDGFYSEVSATAPFTSLTFDDSTGNVLGAATAGGATMIAPVTRSISDGGTLTVTDLSVDLVNRAVYGTVIGGNGLGTVNNLHLWNIGSITGATSANSPGNYITTLSGLSLTSEGLGAFTQALGLIKLGQSALAGVTDFGSITSNLLNAGLDDGPKPIPVPVPEFPEPSTYALMGMGLLGIVAVARRRKAETEALT